MRWLVMISSFIIQAPRLAAASHLLATKWLVAVIRRYESVISYPISPGCDALVHEPKFFTVVDFLVYSLAG